MLTFRPQHAHYSVGKLVELQVDFEEQIDIIERLKEENEQLKRENEQLIATVQEMTLRQLEATYKEITNNGEEVDHAIFVTNVQENVVYEMLLSDYLRYCDLKNSKNPTLKDFTFVDDKTGNLHILNLEFAELDILGLSSTQELDVLGLISSLGAL